MKQIKRFLSDIEKKTSYGICKNEISPTKWVGIGSDTFKLNTVYMRDGFYCLGIYRNEHNSIVELNLYY